MVLVRKPPAALVFLLLCAPASNEPENEWPHMLVGDAAFGRMGASAEFFAPLSSPDWSPNLAVVHRTDAALAHAGFMTS